MPHNKHYAPSLSPMAKQLKIARHLASRARHHGPPPAAMTNKNPDMTDFNGASFLLYTAAECMGYMLGMTSHDAPSKVLIGTAIVSGVVATGLNQAFAENKSVITRTVNMALTASALGASFYAAANLLP